LEANPDAHHMTWSQSNLQVNTWIKNKLICSFSFFFRLSSSTQPNPIHPIQTFWVQSCMVHGIHHLISWSFDWYPCILIMSNVEYGSSGELATPLLAWWLCMPFYGRFKPVLWSYMVLG
jgi:hypothetical protein